MTNDHGGRTSETPGIDIVGWTRGADTAAVASAADAAARTVGFVQVVGRESPEAAATGLADAVDATVGAHSGAKPSGSRGLTPNASAEREAARLTTGYQ